MLPNHGPDCQHWVYPTDCWGCGQSIFILQCTPCGSVVLFDHLGAPWPKHICPGMGGIGGSGLQGWAAADVLRSNGHGISGDILGKLFPRPDGGAQHAHVSIESKAMQPIPGQRLPLLAMLREIRVETKRTRGLDELGAIGAAMLKLPKGKCVQVTLVVNTERPNLSYTCILPLALGVGRSAKDQMVMAAIEGHALGERGVWIVREIEVI